MKKILSGFSTIFLLVALVIPGLAYANGQYILLSNYSGKEGSMTTVNGEGFTPLESISIYIGSNPTALAVTNASMSGSMPPIAVTIPVGLTPESSVNITAKGSSGDVASVPFYVEGYFPSISVASTGNTPFSTLTVTGSGFAPSENVNITMGDFINKDTTSDAEGNLTSVSFQLPNITPDSYTINATGERSGHTAIGYFYVGGFYPNVFPSGFYIIPGQSISFNGGGFAPGETVDVMLGSNKVLSFTVDNVGAYKDAGAYTIPTTAKSGTVTFTLTGELSNSSVSADISIGSFNPQVFPSSYFVLPGDILSFSGIDFPPNETLRIYDSENTNSLNSVTTDAKGNFPELSLGFKIPSQFASTTRTINIVGDSTGSTFTVQIGVGKFTPQLSPSAYYIKPGQNLSVDGWNFLPFENVNVTVMDNQNSTTVANKTGNIKLGPLTIPYSFPNFTLHVTGQESGGMASLSIPISAYTPSVSATNYYVKPGDHISFFGGAFGPSEPVEVTMQSGGTSVGLGIINTNKDGYLLDNDFIIPLTAKSGSSIYQFKGLSSNSISTVTVEIASYVPLISSDNYYPTPGTPIKIWISGFGPSEVLDVYVNGTKVTWATADTVGSAGPIQVNLPIKITSATINVKGETTGLSKDLDLSLAGFNPVVGASTYYLLPGNPISFTGWGFAPNETVTIFQGTNIIGTVTADSEGKFTTSSFVAPFTSDKTVTYSFEGDQSAQTNMVKISLGNYTPYALLSLYYGKPGAAETISGFDFAPGEKVDVTFGGVNLGTVTADAKGTFVINTTVPSGSGNLNLTATGESSGEQATSVFTIANF